MKFQLLSDNILKGIGGIDRRYRMARIIVTLSHYQPDVVLWQEIDDGVPRSGCDRQIDRLGKPRIEPRPNSRAMAEVPS